MAFDLISFDQSGFDVGGSSTILIGAFVQEKVLAVIGTNQEVYINGSTYERITVSESKVGNGIFLNPEFTAEVSLASANGEFSVILNRMLVTETTTHEVECDALIYPDIVSNEDTSGEVECSSVVNLKVVASEEVHGESYTDKNKWLILETYELMSASATLEAVDILTCELNLRLEPGQRLVVDASNYTVLLDGENAVDIQHGEWLDELTRETSSISVTSSAGVSNLEASILYTERYL